MSATRARVDPQAAVDPAARLGRNVTVGPFCVVGAGVQLGDGCRLHSHVTLGGPAEIGPENVFWPGCSVGSDPQDLKYGGEPTRLSLGARNQIRECVTINRGTVGGGGVTTIGDGNLFMAYAHVGHDCTIGSRNIFANAATLAGHVDVGSDATIGAHSGVHQLCRVADHAFIAAHSVVTRDALPWVTTVGNRARAHGLNLVGLKRGGYPAETILALKRCYMRLFRSKLALEQAMQEVGAEYGEVAEVRYMLDFIRSSKRGICR